MNKKARYICFEGTEGVGKTTQTKKLVDHLRSKGFKVLQTKEPGTPLSPLTMLLRGVMLDRQYEDEITAAARELISQAIRSIHMDRIVIPALSDHDFIIQDRGALSGLAYGSACGNDIDRIISLSEYATENARLHLNDGIYDDIIYLKGDISTGLSKALSSKKEFAAGDAMEAKGKSFMQTTSYNMDEISQSFNTSLVQVDGKSIDEVFTEILNVLKIEE